ncbi:UNVERIFIED_CONTAM: hypothetical protein FKN15_075702 [Acipenser sinensis]
MLQFMEVMMGQQSLLMTLANVVPRAPELPTGPVAGQLVVPPPVPHGQPQEVWDVDAVSRDASNAEPLFEEGTEPEVTSQHSEQDDPEVLDTNDPMWRCSPPGSPGLHPCNFSQGCGLQYARGKRSRVSVFSTTEAVRLSNVASLLTVYQAALLRDLPECLSAALRTELGTIAQLLVKLAQLNARAQGRSIASLVVARRQLWLSQARVQEPDKVPLLDAPISPGHTFGPAVEKMLQHSVKAREASQQLAKMWLSKPFQPRRPQEHQWRRAPPQQQAQSRGSMTAPSGVSARGQPAFVRPQRGGWRPRGGGKPRPRGSGQAPRERAQPKRP